MVEKDPSDWDLIFKGALFVWTVLSALFAFLWTRMNGLQKTVNSNKERSYAELDETKKDLNKHMLHVANNYHSKPDLEKMLDAKMSPIVKTLDEIKAIVNRRDEG